MNKYLLLLALLASSTTYATECLNCTPNQDINNDYNSSEINNSNNATSAPTSIMTNIQNNPASVDNSTIGGISCAPEFLLHGGVGVGQTRANPSDYQTNSETANMGFVWNPAAGHCLESQKSLVAYKHRENNRKSILEDIQFCHWLSTNGIKIGGGFLETYDLKERKRIRQQIVRCKSIVLQPKNNFINAPAKTRQQLAEIKALAKVEKKQVVKETKVVVKKPRKPKKAKGKWVYRVQVATLMDGWCYETCGDDNVTKTLENNGYKNIIYKKGKGDRVIILLGDYTKRSAAKETLKHVRFTLLCDAFIKRRWKAD